MMNIKEAKQEIVNTLHAYLKKDEEGNYTYPLVHQRPLFLIGAPGIGKTAIMEQVAKEENIGLVSYTMTHHTRQSAVGLPKIVSRVYEGISMDVTEYTMSEIIAAVYAKMESTGKKEGILFLDEINCVSETLAPAMLQFLQNKTFGGHKVPAGWLIVAAGNPSGYNKSVREFDIVTLDRVRKMEIQPDLEAWMEYAWLHKIHGAVLSYLNIHRDSFYYIRSSREEKAFVTARGWEDLSRILKSYEDLDIPVTENLICQFIQEKEIGRDFASYYQIYQKYGTDYGIHQILDGSLSKHMEEEKLDMAGNGSAEERLTVTGLFLQDLNERLMCADTGKKRLSLLYDKLYALKNNPITDKNAKSEADSWFGQYIKDQKKSFEVRKTSGLLSMEEALLERQTIACMERYDLELRKLHITKREEQFERIKIFFQEEKQKTEVLCTQTGHALLRAFNFMEKAFGDGAEMMLMVTRLTGNPLASAFIAEHGCAPYFKYSDKLLPGKQQQLLQACEQALESR